MDCTIDARIGRVGQMLGHAATEARMIATLLPFVALLALGACDGAGGRADTNKGSEDPFGATGAPGADMTDNGAADGAAGNFQGNSS